MDDLLEDFIAETRDTLEILSGQLVEWERNPEDRSLVDSVFRFVHTVKGSCGFLDLPRLERLSHAAEDILSAARDGKITVCTEMVTAVLAVIDRISELANALETGTSVSDNDAELIAVMLTFLPAKEEKADQEQISYEPENALGLSGIEEIEQSNNEDHSDIDDEADTFEATEEPSEGAQKPTQRTIRVSLQLLDKLMSNVSDMVLARNEVSRQLRQSGSDNDLDQAFTRLSTTVADMRDAVSLMRMQNIDRLFSSLPRLVRDTMLEVGKDVQLQLQGSEVELDREMVEMLRDPLSHIVRNSIDHGIESPDERRALGKNPTGTINVSARQSGNQIVVEISDDGRGIDISELEKKAVRANIVTPEQLKNMTEKARLGLIFEAGLSTARKISAISGRGVGMDVVRNNLQSIGGTIDLENAVGRGLKITLRLPLTLSIIAGLSVRAGNQIFGVSRNSVEEILSAANQNVELEEFGGMTVAKIRGSRIPYAKLEDILNIDPVEDAEGGRTLIVMQPATGQKFVLEVQNVLDHEELVVKPGAPAIMQNGLFAGTSLPDNGRPMLLLDASGIANDIGFDEQDNHALFEDSSADTKDDNKEQAGSALLFLSRDGRKQALRLSVIDRMEEIPARDFTHVGGGLRVNIDNRLLDVVGLDAMPEADSYVQLLRLTDGEKQLCLAIDQVVDMFTLNGKMTPSRSPELHEGVIDAFDEKVELLNVFSFFEEVMEEATDDVDDGPVCLLASDKKDGWEQKILAPLLRASGYNVSFDPEDSSRAAVILTRDNSAPVKEQNDNRVVRLRDESHAKSSDGGSIYKYDRTGLLAAIESKIAGV